MTTSRSNQIEQLIQSTKRVARCPHAMVYRVVLEEVAAISDAQGGSLFTFERGGLCLRQSLDPGHVPEMIPLPLKAGSPLNAALENRAPILVEDVAQHNNITSSGWAGYNDGSLMILPLTDEDNHIHAIISLHNKRTPPFNQWDLDFCRVFSTFCFEVIRAQKSALVLHETGTYNRQLFDASPLGIVIMNKKGVIYDANPSFCALIGFRDNQVHKKSIWDFTPEEGSEEEQDRLQGIGQTPIRYQKNFIHAEGYQIQVVIHATSLDIHGNRYILQTITSAMRALSNS